MGMDADSHLLLAVLCLVVVAVLASVMIGIARRQRSRAPRSSRGFRDADYPSPQQDYAPMPRAKVRRPGVKTIAIIHDFGNDNSPPSMRSYLTTREAFEVLAQIRDAGEDTPIDIVLHTPGGSAFACEMIAGALKGRSNTTAYVPYCAMSAGTIIALACDKVVMGKHACLGPIDIQFGSYPADSFLRLLQEKPIQSVSDEVVLLAYLAEKEQKSARANACAMLNPHHFGSDNACQLSDFLVSGDMPHTEQIGRERAKVLGVNIEGEDCPAEIYDIVETQLDLLGLAPPQPGMYPSYNAGGTAAASEKTDR